LHRRNHHKQTVSNSESDNDNLSSAAAIQTINNLRFSAKYRRPHTMVSRLASRLSSLASSNSATNYLPTIKPPYNNSSLDRFEDCYRSDRLVQNGIVKRVELVLGQHGKIVMDTTEEFDNPDDRQTALEKITNNQKYQDARKAIQQLVIKPAINFHTNLKASVIQSQVYGRSAIEMVGSDESGLPEALHVLNSKRLAQVEIDPQTWQLLGVHYLDLNKGSSGMEDVLPIETLIYFAYRDYHVSPGSLFYGLSALEGIVDGSDSKRIAKQEDIKEIMKSNWAPFLIMKFINPNITVQQMQEVVNGIQPGLPFAHKQDLETTTVDLQSDLKKLTDAVDFLNRESLRELGVPGFIAGYEQIANYANSQQVLLAFKEIELEADRTWISGVVEQQWLNKLFYQLLDIDPDVDQPEVKLKYTFSDISFETDLDKTNAALLLYDRQIISGEAVLKIAGHEDLIEEYKILQQQKELNQQLMLKQMQEQQQQNQNQQDAQDRLDTLPNQPANQTEKARVPVNTTSTTVKKRQSSVEDILYQKFSDVLDRIVE